MDSAVVLLLAVLAVLPEPTRDPQSDVVTAQRMTERAVFLEEKMSELWEEVEWSRALEEVPLFWLLRHWLYWVAAAAVLCCLAWRRKEACRRRRQQDSCRGEEEELSPAARAVRPLAEPILSLLHIRPAKEQILKKLVRDLLEVSRESCHSNFMPELHPATTTQGTMEYCSYLGHRTLYQLLVYLKPPPKHSFKLQLHGDGGDVPERRGYDIRVLLECSCSRSKAIPLCFAHPTYVNQESPLVHTLCTDSRLEVEKIAGWVQKLLESAWERLPQWHDWQLQVLPSSDCCRLLLTGPCQVQLCAVLLFALQHDRPGTFLVLE